MSVLLQRDSTDLFLGGDERLARADLRRQIGRLERELARLATGAFPRTALDTAVPARSRQPRVLDLGELEAVRDALTARLADARRDLEERARSEAENRELLQRMLAEPARFKWLRISREAVGEPGCGHWHSRPRYGLLGMLLGWWRVRISSGCPLAGRLAAVERKAEER